MVDEYPWRTGRSCVFEVFVHLVFVTKYRRGVFDESILERLREIFAETCEQMGGELIEFGGEDDHVHLMVSCPPRTAISNLVGKLKGKSSHLIRSQYPERIRPKLWGDHLWSPSYCVVSCGGAPLETVKQYVADQRRPPGPKAVSRSRLLAGKKRPQKKPLA